MLHRRHTYQKNKHQVHVDIRCKYLHGVLSFLHARTWRFHLRSYLRPKHLTWRHVVVPGLADCAACAGNGRRAKVPASTSTARDAARPKEAGACSLGETGEAEN